MRAHVENGRVLEVAMARVRAPSDHPNAGMANIIRLSPNPRIVYELQPDLRERPYRLMEVDTNRHGFRGDEIPERRPDTVTIVGLGDSIMFGHGVGHEESYMALLETGLNRLYPQSAWRVVNTAVPGYNTLMEVETLREKGLAFEPDIVVLNIVGNDLAPPKFVRDVSDPFDPSRFFLLEALRPTVVDATDDLAGARGLGLGKQWWDRDENGSVAVPDEYRHLFGIEAFRGALDELAELSRQHGFQVVVFTTYDFGRVDQMVEEARQRGFSCVSLAGELERWMRENAEEELTEETYRRSKLVVGPGNLHPSRVQHWMAAMKLIESMGELGLLERRAGQE